MLNNPTATFLSRPRNQREQIRSGGNTEFGGPGKEPELVRTTIGGNGTTFDLQGRLIVCKETTGG